MRKYTRGLSLLLVLSMLSGCGVATTPPAGQGETDAFIADTMAGELESDISKETETEPGTPYEQPTEGGDKSGSETLDYTVKYVPVGERVFTDPSRLPEKALIGSANELTEFCEQWEEFYDLERGTMYPHMAGFRETIKAYDAKFWEEHDVIIVGAAQSSGSILHNIRKISRTDNHCNWIIEVEQLIPEGLNELIQTWFIVIEVPKGKIEHDEQLEVQWFEVYEAETEHRTEIEVPLKAQYIRTGELAEYEGEPKRPFRVVRSADELEAYYEEYKDIYYLGRNEKVYSDTTIGFLDACDRFDEAFWGQYDLVLTATIEPSGSIRHEVVNMVSTDGGKEWVINTRVISPELQTCDIAFWYFLIEVPKGMIEETDKVTFNAVYDTDREGLYGGNVQYIRTDNYVDTAEEKSPYFLLESREELLEYCEAYRVSDGFADACDKYDEGFWKYNKLLVVLTYEKNSSIRYEAVELFKNKLINGGEWQLRVNRLLPDKNLYGIEAGESLWHLLIEIPDYDYNHSKRMDRMTQEDEIAIIYTDTPVEAKSLYKVQYIRTDLQPAKKEDLPQIERITSQAELDAYYHANKYTYELVWRDWCTREITGGFLNACERFTPLFWEQNDLVMIVLYEDNKWTRHEVEEIFFSEGDPQECVITISKTTSRESDEPANWHILLPVPKGQVWGEENVKLNFIEVCTEEK